MGRWQVTALANVLTALLAALLRGAAPASTPLANLGAAVTRAHRPYRGPVDLDRTFHLRGHATCPTQTSLYQVPTPGGFSADTRVSGDGKFVYVAAQDLPQGSIRYVLAVGSD
jgi:hypothetical protein